MSPRTEIPDVVTAATAVQVRPGEQGAFAGWLTQLNAAIATLLLDDGPTNVIPGALLP